VGEDGRVRAGGDGVLGRVRDGSSGIREGEGTELLRLVTEDGVRLAGRHLPARVAAGGDSAGDSASGNGGDAGGGALDLAVVVAHGFTGSWRRPAFRAICHRLSRAVGVVAVDLRGHGDSGGLSTLGAAEVLDVREAVGWARGRGYRRVATLGFSMGGSVVLRHAALYPEVDAVVSVSAPSRWYILDTAPMRRVHWLCETPLGRATARAMGTRIGRVWPRPPRSPVELVHRIPPTPLLVVHGDRDSYFTPEHPRALAAAAGPGCELWLEAGFGHAENAATPDLVDRVAGWLVSRVAGGRSGTILP
jgi:pimeloyl-ACP methyl ester carboxylesterase